MPVKAVWGPYKDGSGWKVIVHYVDSATGESAKNSRREATQEAAQKLKNELLAGIEALKYLRLVEAFEGYRVYLGQKGNRQSSISTTLTRLRDFFQDSERPVAALTARVCQQMYEALTRRPSLRTGKILTADTHRNMLAEAKTFLSWCVERGYLESNPLVPVKGLGRRSHGKGQLRLDEARAFMNKALELARKGDDGATAALIALICGLRASEITNLQVRDLDDNGRVLVVSQGKTKAAARRVSLPEVLQPLVARLTQRAVPAGRVAKVAGPFRYGRRWRLIVEHIDPTSGVVSTSCPCEASEEEAMVLRADLLLGGVGREKLPGDPLFGHHWRNWVLKQAERISELAGLPKVTAHGLRGVCATVATDSGQIGAAVAASLGHENQGITNQSYIKPGTRESRGQRQLLAGPEIGGRPKN